MKMQPISKAPIAKAPRLALECYPQEKAVSRWLTAQPMRREPDHFGETELDLLYIAKRLPEALRLEKLLTEAGLDYLVEPDRYRGGVIFQTERIGAFFYVLPADAEAARRAMERGGFRPYTARH